MLTNDLIDKFYEDVQKLGLKFPVATISKETGLSKGLISDVLTKKKEPSEKLMHLFYDKFRDSLPNVRKVAKDGDSGNGLSGKVILDTSFLLQLANDYNNKLLAEKDARIADLKEVINSGLVDIKNKASDAVISLETALDLLEDLKAGQRTKSDVIIAALEKVGGYEKGALAKELHNQEVAAGRLLKGTGSSEVPGKRRKPVK